MDHEHDPALPAGFEPMLNPTGWPLLHMVAMFYTGPAGDIVGVPMTSEDGDAWEATVPFDGRLFRIDTVYEDPDTRAQAVFWGGDRHEEYAAGEVVRTRAYSPYS
ncbi:MAG: hypothetical protein AB7I38_03340 [Dehalococcoidia bacterium]